MSHELGGAENTGAVGDAEMEVTGNNYTIRRGGKVTDEGELKLDATKDPKQLEYVVTAGVYKWKTYIGIYSLDDDDYKTCDVEKGRERPSRFASHELTSQVAKWRRVGR